MFDRARVLRPTSGFCFGCEAEVSRGVWGATSQAAPHKPPEPGPVLAGIGGRGGGVAWQRRQRCRAGRCVACTAAQWGGACGGYRKAQCFYVTPETNDMGKTGGAVAVYATAACERSGPTREARRRSVPGLGNKAGPVTECRPRGPRIH